MRVLVSGGAGFLGSHLCERLLEQGNKVLCLDNVYTGTLDNLALFSQHPDFTLLPYDVCEPLNSVVEHVGLGQVDRIYHLACPASPIHYQRDPVRTIRTCIQGTLAMLDLARAVGARLLFTSTSEVYGDALVHPQSETYWGNVNPIGPRACYDEGKRCAEALAISYARQYGVEVRIARVFNTYGARMQPHDGRVVSTFIHQCLRGEPLTIFGSGRQTRSFCYVDDLISGLIALMDSPVCEPINLGNPREYSIRDLALLIRSMVASNSAIIELPLPQDDPTRRQPDISRARSLLGWEPMIALETGLERMIKHARAQLHRGHDASLAGRAAQGESGS